MSRPPPPLVPSTISRELQQYTAAAGRQHFLHPLPALLWAISDGVLCSSSALERERWKTHISVAKPGLRLLRFLHQVRPGTCVYVTLGLGEKERRADGGGGKSRRRGGGGEATWQARDVCDTREHDSNNNSCFTTLSILERQRFRP